MMTKVNLFINYYQDKHADRQKELDTCIVNNINNTQIDNVIIIALHSDIDCFLKLIENKLIDDNIVKIKLITFQQPSFNNYFTLTEKYPEDINIISNLDIIMDVDSIIKLKNWNWKNYCLALCRWDFIDYNLETEKAVHYNHSDSQDTWIIKGAFKQLDGANFGLGKAGCDNVIAHKLSFFYNVINPSIDIKTFHYHLSNIRNYTDIIGQSIGIIPPPYKLLTPITLPNE